MKTMDTNISLADYYFPLLDSLSRTAKLYLVKRLSESLLGSVDRETICHAEAEKEKILDRLSGVWADDPEAEYMDEAIRTGRTSNHTRHLVSLDE